jgi:hypothetical protein
MSRFTEEEFLAAVSSLVDQGTIEKAMTFCSEAEGFTVIRNIMATLVGVSHAEGKAGAAATCIRRALGVGMDILELGTEGDVR